MYLMYVDESGDTGLTGSPTGYFVLTGLVVHELRWQTYLEKMIQFRQRMRSQFGLKLREEIHAVRFLSRSGQLSRIPKHERLTILRALTKELSQMADLSVINIVVKKTGKPSDYDVFENAWTALIQRFENTISFRNFPGPANADERGMIFPDRTDDKKLTQLLRRMRKWNPTPNQQPYGSGYRNLTLSKVIEDPNFKDSEHSYYVQACDLIAYLLMQKMIPNAYIKKKTGAGDRYFNLLDPILCKVAATNEPQGIVYL